MGNLTLSDDRTRVLAERASDTAPFATLVAKIPVRHAVTFYSRFGDWFAWLEVILLAFILFTGPWRGVWRRNKP
jgi:apolipoprotein N-acyltransferase